MQAFLLPFHFDDEAADEAASGDDVDDVAERAGRIPVLEIGFGVYMLMRHLMDYSSEFSARVHPDAAQDDVVGGGGGDGDGGMHNRMGDGDAPHDAPESSGEIRFSRTKRAFGFGRELLPSEDVVTYAEAFAFFNKHTVRVEVCRHRKLERFYFANPPLTEYLTLETKNELLFSVNRESAAKKIAGFFDRIPSLLSEMRHQQQLADTLRRIPGLGALIVRRAETLKTVSFTLAIVINTLILVCFEHEPGKLYGAGQCNDRVLARRAGLPVSLIIAVLGGLQSVTSLFVVLLFYLNHGVHTPHRRRRRRRRRALTRTARRAGPIIYKSGVREYVRSHNERARAAQTAAATAGAAAVDADADADADAANSYNLGGTPSGERRWRMSDGADLLPRDAGGVGAPTTESALPPPSWRRMRMAGVVNLCTSPVVSARVGVGVAGGVGWGWWVYVCVLCLCVSVCVWGVRTVCVSVCVCVCVCVEPAPYAREVSSWGGASHARARPPRSSTTRFTSS